MVGPVAVYLLALLSSATVTDAAVFLHYKPMNLSANSLALSRTIRDVSRALCAASCSAAKNPSCNSYRYGSASEPRLCLLGKHQPDSGSKFRSGTFTTFLRLKSSDNGCFAMMPSAVNYNQGLGVCNRIGGKLPEPRTQEEVDQLLTIIGQFGTRLGFKQAGAVYRWRSDGSVVERSVGGTHSQGCGRLLTNGGFYRMICGGSGMPFGCQFC